MQIQRVNHGKIGQCFQGQEAILFFHYAGSLLLNMMRRSWWVFLGGLGSFWVFVLILVSFVQEFH